MKPYTFRKGKGRWYLELPPRPKEFNQTDFTQVEESCGALDELAHGKSQVDISIDTGLLKSSSVLEREPVSAAAGQGGCYRTGRLLKDHLNLTDLALLLFGRIPRTYLPAPQISTVQIEKPTNFGHQ